MRMMGWSGEPARSADVAVSWSRRILREPSIWADSNSRGVRTSIRRGTLGLERRWERWDGVMGIGVQDYI